MPSGTARTGGRRPPWIGCEVIAANGEVFRRDLSETHDHSTFEEKELRASLTGGRPGNLIDKGRSLAHSDPTRRSNGRVQEAVRGDGGMRAASRRSANTTTRTPGSRGSSPASTVT